MPPGSWGIFDRMSMKHFLLAGVAGLGLLQGLPCNSATEMEERAEIQAAAEQGFRSDDFETLEKTSSAYRKKRTRTASGLWKLTIFYAGVEKAMTVFPWEQETDFDSLEKKTRAWVAKYPESPAAHIAHSMVLVKRAWHHRGSGDASSVTPEGWIEFHKYVGAARTYLEKHKDIASGDPRWYEQMLLIARAENWPRAEFDKLLDEALDREPVFYQTYFSALQYLLPKWHGGVEEIEDFARYAVDKSSRLEGQGMYARIYWYASQTEFENDLFNNSLVEWPRMKAGFEDVVSRYPDAWNLNNYARFACLARDKATTAELMRRIGSSVVSEAWNSKALKNECVAWASQP